MYLMLINMHDNDVHIHLYTCNEHIVSTCCTFKISQRATVTNYQNYSSSIFSYNEVAYYMYNIIILSCII